MHEKLTEEKVGEFVKEFELFRYEKRVIKAIKFKAEIIQANKNDR